MLGLFLWFMVINAIVLFLSKHQANQTMHCKNCGTEFEGNFCPNCGQNAKVHKLTFTSLLEELTDNVFQINKGFFYTIIALFKTPGHTIRGYVEGQRKPLFKPIAFAFTMATLHFLVLQLTEQNPFIGDLLTGFYEGAKELNEENHGMMVIIDFVKNHYPYFTLLLLPFYAFGSLLPFYDYRYNFFDHTVLNAYIMGQQALIYSIGSFVVFLIPDAFWVILVPFFAGIGYTFWTLFQFFFRCEANKSILAVSANLFYLGYWFKFNSWRLVTFFCWF